MLDQVAIALCTDPIQVRLESIPTEWFGHAGDHFSRPGEGPASVRGKHVVDHQHIASLPAEGDLLFDVCAAKCVQHFGLDLCSVAVVRVVGQIILAEFSHKNVADAGFQSCYMEEGEMIEPDHFTCSRVSRSHATSLACPQTIAVLPFEANVVLAAVPLNGSFIVGLESVLPCEAWAASKVPYVQIAFLKEPLFYAVIYVVIDLAAVCDGRFSSMQGWRHAHEENLAREPNVVRLLVMQKDSLVGRVFGRCVHIAAHLTARR